MTRDMLFVRPKFDLMVDNLEVAEIIQYKVLMLPPDGIPQMYLKSIRQFIKDFLQRQVSNALSLFANADDHHKNTTAYNAKQAKESALEAIRNC